jgi:hypothetical protein
MFENHSTVPFRETVVKVMALVTGGYASVRVLDTNDITFGLV